MSTPAPVSPTADSTIAPEQQPPADDTTSPSAVETKNPESTDTTSTTPSTVPTSTDAPTEPVAETKPEAASHPVKQEETPVEQPAEKTAAEATDGRPDTTVPLSTEHNPTEHESKPEKVGKPEKTDAEKAAKKEKKEREAAEKLVVTESEAIAEPSNPAAFAEHAPADLSPPSVEPVYKDEFEDDEEIAAENLPQPTPVLQVVNPSPVTTGKLKKQVSATGSVTSKSAEGGSVLETLQAQFREKDETIEWQKSMLEKLEGELKMKRTEVSALNTQITKLQKQLKAATLPPEIEQEIIAEPSPFEGFFGEWHDQYGKVCEITPGEIDEMNIRYFPTGKGSGKQGHSVSKKLVHQVEFTIPSKQGGHASLIMTRATEDDLEMHMIRHMPPLAPHTTWLEKKTAEGGDYI